ncbi:MAG: C2 family cysteine protease [Actinomycetes bacterium]
MADRITADPAALDALTREGLAAVRDAEADVARYADALRTYTAAPADGSIAPEVRSLEGRVTEVLDEVARLDRAPAAFADALRNLDRHAPLTPTDRRWRSTLDAALLDELVRLRLEHPLADEVTLWGRTTAGAAALAAVREALGASRTGVGRRHLTRIEGAVVGLRPEQVDAVLAGLTDDELARLGAALDRDWSALSGWDRARSHTLLTAFTSVASLAQVRRLARHTALLDPDPRTVARWVSTGPAAERATLRLGYRPVDGVLWGEDPADRISVRAVDQGDLGDCTLMGTLLALADRAPAVLARAIRPNANGTVTVSFASGAQVTVTPDLPVRAGDAGTVFARVGEETLLGPARWPLLVEKAWAQHEGGWDRIADRAVRDPLVALSGAEVETIAVHAEPEDAWTATRLRALLDRGPVLLSTYAEHDAARLGIEAAAFRDGRIAPSHAYHLVDVEGDEAWLANPWDGGAALVRLPLAELRRVTAFADVAAVGDARPADRRRASRRRRRPDRDRD